MQSGSAQPAPPIGWLGAARPATPIGLLGAETLSPLAGGATGTAVKARVAIEAPVASGVSARMAIVRRQYL